MIDPRKFLEDLSGRYARFYTDAIQKMVVALATGNKPAFSAARKELDEVIAETMGAAEVLGATITLQRAAALIPSEGLSMSKDTPYLLAFADQPTQTIIPRVTLDEAIQDMLDRTPVTIRGAAERTAQRISQLYGEGRVVAFTRSAEQAVTERVRDLITKAMREGITEVRAGRMIVESVDTIGKATEAWSESYARMVFRTNANTAITAGRFRQSQDPIIKAVVPCKQFMAVGPPESAGGETRNNHWSADMLVFKVDNPIWNTIAPPLGYNCRCTVRDVSIAELRRMNRLGADGSIREDKLPPSAHPDPGFRHGGRPDLFMVQASR